jgi:hypothetical protein
MSPEMMAGRSAMWAICGPADRQVGDMTHLRRAPQPSRPKTPPRLCRARPGSRNGARTCPSSRVPSGGDRRPSSRRSSWSARHRGRLPEDGRWHRRAPARAWSGDS